MSDFEKGWDCYYKYKNYKSAEKHWENAASNGDSMAAILLGQMYLTGMSGQFGVGINFANAQKYLEQGANSTKISGVEYLVGIAYLKQQKYLDAKAWFLKASIQNMTEAQWELAMLYIANHIPGRGYEAAYFWLTIASKKFPSATSFSFLQTVKSRINAVDEQKIRKNADTCIEGVNNLDSFISYL